MPEMGTKQTTPTCAMLLLTVGVATILRRAPQRTSHRLGNRGVKSNLHEGRILDCKQHAQHHPLTCHPRAVWILRIAPRVGGTAMMSASERYIGRASIRCLAVSKHANTPLFYRRLIIASEGLRTQKRACGCPQHPHLLFRWRRGASGSTTTGVRLCNTAGTTNYIILLRPAC